MEDKTQAHEAVNTKVEFSLDDEVFDDYDDDWVNDTSLEEDSRMDSLTAVDYERDEEEKERQEDKGEVRDESVESLSGEKTKYVSGLYGLILVSLGCVMPIAQVYVPTKQSPSMEVFYMILFLTSVLFMCYMYLAVLRRQQSADQRSTSTSSDSSGSAVFISVHNSIHNIVNRFWRRRGISLNSQSSVSEPIVDYTDKWVTYEKSGNFYLRLGAIGFGIGSMIMDGMFLCIYFEGHKKPENHCDIMLDALNPLLRFTFTFTQTMFLFRYSAACIQKLQGVAYFGFMHVGAANLCMWMRVIVIETLHYHHEVKHMKTILDHDNDSAVPAHHLIEGAESSHDSHTLVWNSCAGHSLIGNALTKASLYIYPCVVEYSLISASLLYVMWGKIGKHCHHQRVGPYTSRHNAFLMDCDQSSKGLFLGLLFTASTLVCIMVFSYYPANKGLFISVNVLETIMHIATIVAVIFAGWRMRDLHFRSFKKHKLDQILILIGLFGVYMHNACNIIAGFGSLRTITGSITIITSLFKVVQCTLQVLFIILGLNLSSVTHLQVNAKRGKEFVTFLMVCNFVHWLGVLFESYQPAYNPVQVLFFGPNAWSVLTQVATPLRIFFRFHSTVCLSHVWKNAWKIKKH